MSIISLPNMFFRLILVLITVNFFYANGLLNYKVLFLVGNIFHFRRMSVTTLIGLLVFSILQLTLIYLFSLNIEDRLPYFFSVLLVATGYFGWVGLLLKKKAYNIPTSFFLVLLVLNYLLGNSYLAIDPMILALLYAIKLNEGAIVPGKDFFLPTLFIGLIYSVIVEWRAVFVGNLAGICLGILMKIQPFFRVLLVLAGFSLLILVAQYWIIILELLVNTGSGGDPSSGRFAILSESVMQISELLTSFDIRGLVGNGIGSFGEHFSKSMSITIDILGMSIESFYVPVAGISRLHAHNFLVQSLFELGMFGLIFHCCLIIKLVKELPEYRAFIFVGAVTGLLSGVFYLYSEFFILLLCISFAKKRNFLRRSYVD